MSDSEMQIPIRMSDAIGDTPATYFLSLDVEGVRCFGPRQSLDLSDGNGHPAAWTLLLGNNGVGKTTLLQCLAALQPRAHLSQEKLLAFVPFYSSTHAQGLFGSLLSSYGHFLREFDIEKHSLHDLAITSTIRLGGKLSDDGKGQQIKNYGVTLGGGISRIVAKMQGLICYGYGATRRMGKTSLAERRDSDTSASLFSSDLELLNAEEWLLQADYATRQSDGNDRAQVRRDQIRDVLLKLLPDVEDIQVVPPPENEIQTIVRVKTPYGWVRIQDLSLGYTTMITWLVDFASRLFDRYPNSENPLAEPAICLIDEIDLHLHPKWQRTIMDFLCNLFPNTQFIATAHSPLIVQAATATKANIALLRREGDHVVIDNNPQSIANWRVDQVLTSDLFGLPSARPPDVDKALAERQRILSKAKLTKKDQERLRHLEAQIGNLPTGETPDDIEAMDVIRRAAELLNKG